MMPQLLTVKVKRPRARAIRVWVPVLPVLLIASPVLVLAAVAVVVACLMYQISVARAFGAGWRIMSALPGTRLDLEYERTAVLVSIR